MKQLYKINVANGLDFEAIAECELILKANDNIVVQCERYMDFARVVEPIGDLIEDEKEFERQRAANSKGRHIEGAKIPMILRVANEDDLRQAEENDRQAFEAHNKTLERIRFHGLEMKLIQTHFSFDRKMIIFLFSADGRIDFRELLRDLSGLLKVRVELRQVGVRDEAAILGGVGTCGRPFCCARFLSCFNSINVKMAKQQGLSLNPQNISGSCGRLKCCLQFEAEVYKELNIEQKQLQQELVEQLDAVDDDEEVAQGTNIKSKPQQNETPRQQQNAPKNKQGGIRSNNPNRQAKQQGDREGRRDGRNQQQGQQNKGNRQGGNNQRNPGRQHKNPPKRPMPSPDKQVKRPLPPPNSAQPGE
jgi:cell fate regulator YaaT (PSP1 superfamily)